MPLIVLLCGLLFFGLFGMVIAHHLLIDTDRHEDTGWTEIIGYGAIIVLALMFFDSFDLPLLSSPLELSLNAVGALLPIMVSAYLVMRMRIPPRNVLITVAGTSLAMMPVVTVDGGGIMAHFPLWLIPAMVSALFAMQSLDVLGEGRALALTYVGGCMGSLVGGDLLNLPRVLEAGMKRVELGGAGMLDFVFLTGMVGVAMLWTYLRLNEVVSRRSSRRMDRDHSI